MTELNKALQTVVTADHCTVVIDAGANKEVAKTVAHGVVIRRYPFIRVTASCDENELYHSEGWVFYCIRSGEKNRLTLKYLSYTPCGDYSDEYQIKKLSVAIESKLLTIGGPTSNSFVSSDFTEQERDEYLSELCTLRVSEEEAIEDLFIHEY